MCLHNAHCISRRCSFESYCKKHNLARRILLSNFDRIKRRIHNADISS